MRDLKIASVVHFPSRIALHDLSLAQNYDSMSIFSINNHQTNLDLHLNRTYNSRAIFRMSKHLELVYISREGMSMIDSYWMYITNNWLGHYIERR